MISRYIFNFFFVFFFLAADGAHAKTKEVMLADFEIGIPCSETGDMLGFRRTDRVRGTIVNDGAEGTKSSALFRIQVPEESTPVRNDLFFQGKVRRMYLATGSPEYRENGLNALSFWIRLKDDSMLVNKKNRKITFGVWTYHWEFGDEHVGGQSNNELATDSMMHGYANFGFNKRAAGKWVNVVLTPSAFKQSRYYYHFYAARGTTDELAFFPSVRQFQFHFFPEIRKEEHLQIDQLKLIHIRPVAAFEEDFFKKKVSVNAGDVRVPVVLINPGRRDRKYRVFISSFIGVHRNVLHGAHTLTNGFEAPRRMQRDVGGNGGLGVVELMNSEGVSITEKHEEIHIPAGLSWKGEIVHHIKPEMIGRTRTLRAAKYNMVTRRNTLTTSVIVWDPHDPSVQRMSHLDVLPSNADNGKHGAPPGFPVQKRPAEGWRSEDVPVNQAGAYFVSVILLE